MTDCIFCKIAANELPARKIYEDDHVIAIMDVSQVTPGHTLVISKEHVRNILEYNDEFAATIFSRVPKIAKAVKNHDPNIKGLNILMNNEEIASQTVFHSHIHILPRYSDNDGFGLKWENNADKYSDNELDRTRDKIIEALEKSE